MPTRSSAALAALFTAAALVAVTSSACRGPAFQLADGEVLPVEEQCDPAPDARAGADCGVFVKPGATDGDGARESPVGSLMEALSLGGGRVYVCGDVLEEVVVLAEDAEIVAGLACDGWVFDLDARTELTAPPGAVPLTIGANVTTSIEGLRVVAQNAAAPSSSSVAVVVAAGADVSFARCDLIAGDGAAGEPGEPGEPGATGVDANAGTSTVGGAGGPSLCLAEGGKGGNPGTGPSANGASGQPASQANGGALGCTNGDVGSLGGDGDDADPIDVEVTLSIDGYAQASGEPGLPGNAGGGGGGGGGITGAGGGGGGAGGCPGAAGSAGTSGGASIALVTLGASIAFDESTAMVGNGGDGAPGGDGGQGGDGGDGASGAAGACSGASGGAGGDGGRGADGLGGPSAIVAYLGAQPSLNGLDVVAPTPQQAGASPSGELAVAAVALAVE